MISTAAEYPTIRMLDLAHNSTDSMGDITRDLVVQAAKGDPIAFESLVGTYRNVVSSIALAILKDVEASEEVAQEVFVTAWQRLTKLRNPSSFLPWLRQMTRSYAIDSIRRRIRVRKLSHDAESVTAMGADPRSVLIRDEEIAALRKALDMLPDDTREIFTLYYREDKSVRQVALLLDLTESTVKQRLARGRSRLQSELEAPFASAVKNTIPGAAFAAGVMGAVTLVAPATGFAAGVGAVKAANAAGIASTAATGLTFSLAAGFAAGAGAILFGMSRAIKQAIDSRERRGLYILTAVKMAAVIALVGSIGSGYDFKAHPLAAMGLIFGYWLVMFTSSVFGITHVTRRRRELLKIEDPEAWSKEQLQTRRGIIVSIVVLVVVMVWLAVWLHAV